MFKRKDSLDADGATDEGAAVQAARTRARRRLIGAALLVGIGIIGFPLLFETQPRPIAPDIPIETPPREPASPAKPPAAQPGTPSTAAPAEQPPVETPAASPAANTAASASVAAPAAPPAPASQTVAARAERDAPPAAPSAPAAPPRASNDAQRAQAILDGKPTAVATATAAASAPEKAARYVVQAGAYTEAGALRDARQKVEKLGLKTYTQVIESDAGRRTRVRVGPFDSRDAAEKAAARIKSAGLAATILSL